MQTGLFNARGVVQTLERLMNEVTKERTARRPR